MSGLVVHHGFDKNISPSTWLKYFPCLGLKLCINYVNPLTTHYRTLVKSLGIMQSNPLFMNPVCFQYLCITQSSENNFVILILSRHFHLSHTVNIIVYHWWYVLIVEHKCKSFYVMPPSSFSKALPSQSEGGCTCQDLRTLLKLALHF